MRLVNHTVTVCIYLLEQLAERAQESIVAMQLEIKQHFEQKPMWNLKLGLGKAGTANLRMRPLLDGSPVTVLILINALLHKPLVKAKVLAARAKAAAQITHQSTLIAPLNSEPAHDVSGHMPTGSG